MAVRFQGIVLAAVVGGLAWAAERAAAEEVVVRIGVAPGMKFDPERFAVEPGAAVRLEFTNDDHEMPHNLVITGPGERQRVATAALDLGAEGPRRNYVPDAPEVLHHTRVLAAGESQTLRFTAPEAEGVYPYVCTFPGHGFIMFGAMYVTRDPLPPLDEDPHVPPAEARVPEAVGDHDHGAEAGAEPRVQRMFLPDSGPASIAVRLPNGHAYCWDAGSARLRYIWRGGFIDATDHWLGNGSEMARVVGRVYYRAPDGFPLRMGGEGTGEPAEVRFGGYRMIDGLPEFEYEVDGVAVRERIAPAGDGAGVDRHFTIEAADRPVRFVTDPDGGAAFAASAGTWSGGVLTLSPEEARRFTITMAERRGVEPLGYWSMNDDPPNVGFGQTRLVDDGVVGRAMTFRGDADAGDGDGLGTRIETGRLEHGAAFTAWVRLADAEAEQQVIFGTRAADGEGALVIGHNVGGESGFGIVNRDSERAEGLHAGEIGSAGRWHHVAATISPERMTLYVDGERRGSAETPGIRPHGAELHLGAKDDERCRLRGELDEVRIYDRVLSDAEVRAMHERERPVEGASR